MGGTEGQRITAGTEMKIAHFDFAKVGLTICYDMRYPVFINEMMKKGVQIIAMPTAWLVPNEVYNEEETRKYAQEMFISMCRTRAYDNALFLIVSNQTKQISDAFCGIGNSMIISPTSQVIANAEDRECAIYADIDVQEAKYMKQLFPVDKIDYTRKGLYFDMPFEFEKQKIEDVILVKPKVFGDNRGFFMETYKKSDFFANGITEEFVQDNHSKSTKGVLRGLHYQAKPYGQAKLVRCSKGIIYDVAVDIRKDSKTYGQYVKVELSEENKHMLFIPNGFAHGFVALTDEVELLYKTGGEYAPSADRGIFWKDEDINIDWEIDFEPILSEKDKVQPKFKDINKEELI